MRHARTLPVVAGLLVGVAAAAVIGGCSSDSGPGFFGPFTLLPDPRGTLTPTPTPGATPTPTTPTPTPTPGESVNVAGNWSGTVGSQDRNPNCVGTATISMTLFQAQGDDEFIGNFTMSALGQSVSGSIRGTVSGSDIFGTVSVTPVPGCVGTGSFTGIVQGDQMFVSVPKMTAQPDNCGPLCGQNGWQVMRI